MNLAGALQTPELVSECSTHLPFPSRLNNTPANFIAGKTRLSISNWKKVTSDVNILTWAMGVSIDFTTLVDQASAPRPYAYSATDIRLIDDQLRKMLNKGIIETATPSPGQFVSNIFYRPSKDVHIRRHFFPVTD